MMHRYVSKAIARIAGGVYLDEEEIYESARCHVGGRKIGGWKTAVPLARDEREEVREEGRRVIAVGKPG